MNQITSESPAIFFQSRREDRGRKKQFLKNPIRIALQLQINTNLWMNRESNSTPPSWLSSHRINFSPQIFPPDYCTQINADLFNNHDESDQRKDSAGEKQLVSQIITLPLGFAKIHFGRNHVVNNFPSPSKRRPCHFGAIIRNICVPLFAKYTAFQSIRKISSHC